MRFNFFMFENAAEGTLHGTDSFASLPQFSGLNCLGYVSSQVRASHVIKYRLTDSGVNETTSINNYALLVMELIQVQNSFNSVAFCKSMSKNL